MNVKKVYQYSLLVVGSVLFPIGVTWFIAPWDLNTGGIVGIAQILSYVTTGGMKLAGVFNLLMNIPLFLLAWKALSRDFVMKTLMSIVIQSTLLSCLPSLSQPLLPDVLSNLIFGGVICGFGVGLCLQSAGSAGGLDILGVYMASRRPDFSVGKLSYIINAFVLGISAFIYGLPVALYSILFIILMYFVSDRVHLQNISMVALIVTSNPDLKSELMKKTRRGVTEWNGQGAFTGSDKEILLCAMNRYEVRSTKKLVHEIDPKAFFLLMKGKTLLGNFERRLTE